MGLYPSIDNRSCNKFVVRGAGRKTITALTVFLAVAYLIAVVQRAVLSFGSVFLPILNDEGVRAVSASFIVKGVNAIAVSLTPSLGEADESAGGNEGEAQKDCEGGTQKGSWKPSTNYVSWDFRGGVCIISSS